MLAFGGASVPERCEDCRPETGPGSRLAEQLGRNLCQLRTRARIERKELGARAGIGPAEIARVEGDDPPELHTATLLRLCHSLGSSVDELTERIYWNPAEINVRNGEEVWLAGFFLVPPPGAPTFDLDRAPVQVATGRQAAREFGDNVRAARERRHFTQARLADAAGLSRSGLSLVERGLREATLTTLLALARALQVPPELLLEGIEYRRDSQLAAPSPYGGARSHAARSRDGEVVDLWNAGRSAAEIADAIGTTPRTVATMIHRLRERGEPVPYRRPPLTSAQREARLRRRDVKGRGVSTERSSSADGDEGGASRSMIAKRIGANLGFHRRRSGLSLRHLADAAQLDYTQIHRFEKGKEAVPGPAALIRIAACVNVRCGALTAGIRWDAAAGIFRVGQAAPGEEQPLQRLGRNALAARRRSGFSQESLGAAASVGRYVLSDFEHGRKALRVFTLARVAAALGQQFAELFAGVPDWYVRPLPPPEYTPGEEPPSRKERAAHVVRLWGSGASEREIAECVELSPAAVASLIRDLRDAGEDVPYRRRPRRPRSICHRPTGPSLAHGRADTSAERALEGPRLDEVRAAELEAMVMALADRHRIRMINMLASAGGQVAVRIRDFALLGIPERATAHHLKKLVEAGLVEREMVESSPHFRLVPEALKSLRAALAPSGDHGT